MQAHVNFKAISFAFLLMVGGFGTAFAASSSPVTIHALLWRDSANGPIGRAMALAVASFNSSNSDEYQVIPQWVSPRDYKAVLEDLIASGKTPDVIQADYAELKALDSQGKLFSLTSALAADQFWKTRFPAGALEPFTTNGKIIAAPAALQVGILYFNTALFDQSLIPTPHTMSDLVVDISALKQNGIKPIVFENMNGVEEGLIAEQIAVREAGQSLFTNVIDGSSHWTNDGMIQSAKVLDQLISTDAFPRSSVRWSNSLAVASFENGDAAMLYSNDPRLLTRFESIDSPIRDKVDAVPFPAIQDNMSPNTQAWVGTPELNLAVSQSSAVKDAAIDFIKNLTSPFVQKTLAGLGFLPVTTDTLDLHGISPLVSRVRELTRTMPTMEAQFTDAMNPAMAKDYENAISQIFSGSDPVMVFSNLDREESTSSGSAG